MLPPQLGDKVQLEFIVDRIFFNPDRNELYIWYKYISNSSIFLIKYPQQTLFNRGNYERNES